LIYREISTFPIESYISCRSVHSKNHSGGRWDGYRDSRYATSAPNYRSHEQLGADVIESAGKAAALPRSVLLHPRGEDTCLARSRRSTNSPPANHMNITFILSTRCLNRERLEIVSITSCVVSHANLNSDVLFFQTSKNPGNGWMNCCVFQVYFVYDFICQ